MGLTACSPSNPSTSSENLQGNIIFWIEQSTGLTETAKAESQERINEILAEFNVLYPKINVLTDFFNSRQLLKQFIQESQRGAAANILLVRMNSDISQFIQSGVLQSLDEYNIDLGNFSSKALLQAQYQNKLYGIPLFLSTQTLCYNTRKVQQPAQTLSELVEQARKGYSVGFTSGFEETLWGTGIFAKSYLDLLLESEEHTDPITDDNRQILSLVNRGGWIEWMQWLKEAQNEPNFIVTEDHEALKQAFLDNKLAYLTCSSDWIPYSIRILGRETLGVTLLPHEANSATPLLRTWMYVFNRASSVNQMKLSLKLAEFFTNTQQQRRLLAEEIVIPVNIEVSPNPVLYPIRTTLMEQAQSSLSFSLDDSVILHQITELGERLYRRVIAGEITPEVAAEQLAELIKS